MSRRNTLSVFSCLLTVTAWAQTPTAEITGLITDASGASVSSATVTIVNLGTNAGRVSTTNSQGIYDAPALAPGMYSIRVAMAGVKGETRNNIELQVGCSPVLRTDRRCFPCRGWVLAGELRRSRRYCRVVAQSPAGQPDPPVDSRQIQFGLKLSF